MKAFYLISLLAFCCNAHAQIYADRSDLLPEPWAQGQTMDVKSADLNGDGYIDLIFANEFQRNTILLGSENGAFQYSNQNAMSVVNDSEDVIVEDFDQDGDLDLIFCSEDDINLGESNVHELYLNNEGSFVRSSFRFPDTEANAVIKMDVNNDGLVDVLFGNKGPVVCMIANGDGTFSNESERFPETNKTTQDLHAFDADRDGDLDVFEANENGNLIYLNDEGQFTLANSDNFPQDNIETRKVDSGDFDKDGDLDLFLSNVAFIPGKDRQNQLWLNDGTGSFSNATDMFLPTDNDHTIDGIFSDVDLDGDLDLLLANVFGGPCRILVFEEDVYEDRTVEIIGEYFYRDALSLIHEDLNGDGFKDIYIADRNTGSGNKDVLLLFDRTNNLVEEQSNNKVEFYPNPTRKELKIRSETTTFDRIMIYDLNGQLLDSLNFNGIREHTLNVEKYRSAQINIILLRSESPIYNGTVLLGE